MQMMQGWATAKTKTIFPDQFRFLFSKFLRPVFIALVAKSKLVVALMLSAATSGNFIATLLVKMLPSYTQA
jgi:hypothetical protein